MDLTLKLTSNSLLETTNYTTERVTTRDVVASRMCIEDHEEHGDGEEMSVIHLLYHSSE